MKKLISEMNEAEVTEARKNAYRMWQELEEAGKFAEADRWTNYIDKCNGRLQRLG